MHYAKQKNTCNKSADQHTIIAINYRLLSIVSSPQCKKVCRSANKRITALVKPRKEKLSGVARAETNDYFSELFPVD